MQAFVIELSSSVETFVQCIERAFIVCYLPLKVLRPLGFVPAELTATKGDHDGTLWHSSCHLEKPMTAKTS